MRGLDPEIALATAAFVACYMGAAWLASVLRRDASLIDPLWGPGFLGVALVALARSAEPAPRAWLVTALAGIWALRLGAYLAWRSLGEPEDHRYAEMRRKRGRRFVWFSLYGVFGLQGVLLWLVSLPLQLAPSEAGGWSWSVGLGLALWCVGMFFEVVGDAQLARFRRDPANAGRVLDTGLWRYTRHPNYFGECLIWWGIWLASLGGPERLWSVLSPLLMTFLLLRVSGVTLLERALVARRGGYADYVARTSVFFPRRPRSG